MSKSLQWNNIFVYLCIAYVLCTESEGRFAEFIHVVGRLVCRKV